MRLTKLFSEFLESEQSSGIVLLLCTVASLGIANSILGEGYLELLHAKVGFDVGVVHLKQSVEHWINDGLMVIFFLLIGLEIEREIYAGELSDLKNASLPIFAAIGGMLTPALFHFLLNRGTETQSGFGVPMATDIAFALGVLALLGSRIPTSLKVFLTALAIIDDLGAILIISVAKFLRLGTLVKMGRLSRPQAIVGWATFGFTLLLAPRIDRAVMIGIGLAILVHLWRELRVHVRSKYSAATATLRLEPKGVLFFASAPILYQTFLDELAAHPKATAGRRNNGSHQWP